MSDDFSKRVEALSDEKRELLEIFLKERRIDTEWLQDSYVAPSTPVEETLAEIWQDVLGIERVGIHDNFFELGGDSILSIQIIARANQEGLVLASNHDLLEKPTIAELAPLLTRQAVAESTTGAPLRSEIFLAPAQRLVLQSDGRDALRDAAPVVAVEVPAGLDPARLEPLATELERCHDAFRIRVFEQNGSWRVRRAAPAPPSMFRRPFGADADETEREYRRELRLSLDPELGPLFRPLLVEPTPERPGRLLLALHPLVSDDHSLWLLREELDVAVRQAAAREEIVLPAETTSFQRWTQELAERARTPEAADEVERYLECLAGDRLRLPYEGEAAAGAVAEVVRTLGPEEAVLLTEEVPAAHRVVVEDLLVAALAAALRETIGGVSDAPVVLGLERRGHTAAARDGLDLSRTVGDLAVVFPLRIEPVTRPERERAVIETLRRIKEARRAVPGSGLGLETLRHLGPGDMAKRLTASEAPQIVLGYRGRLRETAGAEASPAERGGHSLRMLCRLEGDRAVFSCAYHPGELGQATVERLAERMVARLDDLLGICRRSGETAITPSDFDDTDLDRDDLDAILASEP